ncbi:MAG TPA: prefoldin subunit [Candidatus Diapherotrites archaeon]|jgi:prefoldin beta subunit|nr:prefoldin subunit [Candidatus Diapherotrites archaeon]
MSDNVNLYRQQLMFLTQQKQQLQFQKSVLENTIKELEKTKEKKVYKGVGNVFILSDKEDVLKDTKDLKETTDLRIKNIQKQEDVILKKINEKTKAEGKDKPEEKGKMSGVQ